MRAMKHRTHALVPALLLLTAPLMSVAPACGGDGQGSGSGLELPGPDIKTDAPSDGLTTIDTSKDKDAKPDEDLGPTPDASKVDTVSCDAIDAEPCATPGATRCALEGAVVETCKDVGGCLGWAADTPCPTVNKCTGVADVCVDGACVPPDGQDPNAKCTQPTQQCKASVCNPQTGLCAVQNANDNTPCNDFDVCTDDDICFNGVCQGSGSCPKGCQTQSLSCGSALMFDLNSGATDVMSAYGCEGAETGGYAGWERSFIASSLFDCDDAELSVELTKETDAGSKFVDLVALGTNNGICWPAECVDLAQMDAEGRAQMIFDLIKDENLVLVADGRDGYFGKVRLSLSCCGQQVESFCGDGVDNDGDGLTDCADDDCAGFTCNSEYHCSDGVDNDSNGKTDCDDPQCAAADECNVEGDCTDEIDNDDDGATDCDDVDCVGTAACAVKCETAIPLTCGDTLTAQDVESASNLMTTFSCSRASGLTYGGGQLAYLVEPDCAGQYQIKLTADAGAGAHGAFEAFGLSPGCSGDSCTGSSIATLFGVDTMNRSTATTPFTWLVVAESPELANSSAGTYSLSVTCQCD